MTTVESVTVDASEIREGDLVVFLGEVHRVTSIEPYAVPNADWTREGRLAWGEPGWSITLFPGTAIEVIR